MKPTKIIKNVLNILVAMLNFVHHSTEVLHYSAQASLAS